MKYIIALLLTSSILFAQSDSTFNYILPELKISVNKSGKPETYLFSRDTNKFYISKDKLTADSSLYNWEYDLNKINSVQFKNGVSTLGGALYGGYISGGIALAYGILEAIAYRPKAVEIALVLPGFAAAGFLAGAIIGGFLGSFIPAYDTYDKFSSENNYKKEQLRKILYKHNLNIKNIK